MFHNSIALDSSQNTLAIEDIVKRVESSSSTVNTGMNNKSGKASI